MERKRRFTPAKSDDGLPPPLPRHMRVTVTMPPPPEGYEYVREDDLPPPTRTADLSMDLPPPKRMLAQSPGLKQLSPEDRNYQDQQKSATTTQFKGLFADLCANETTPQPIEPTSANDSYPKTVPKGKREAFFLDEEGLKDFGDYDSELPTAPIQDHAEELSMRENLKKRRRVVTIDAAALGYDKTPLQVVNEMYPGLEWETIRQGPPSKPFFSVQVKIDGELYIGFGSNKKEARHKCANSVIEAMGEEDFGKKGGLTSIARSSTEQTTHPIAFKESHLIKRAKKMKAMGQSSYVAADRGKTPAQLIYEKCVGQKISFEFVSEELLPPNGHIFTMQCVINDSKFYGTATSKKQAKQNAAAQALNDLFNWVPPTETDASSSSQSGAAATTAPHTVVCAADSTM